MDESLSPPHGLINKKCMEHKSESAYQHQKNLQKFWWNRDFDLINKGQFSSGMILDVQNEQ